MPSGPDFLRLSHSTSAEKVFAGRRVHSPHMQKVWTFWRGLAGAGGAPSYKTLDPGAIPSSLAHLVLTKVHHEPRPDFEFLILGNHVDDRMGRNYKHRRFSQLDGYGPGSSIRKAYETVRDERVPILASFDYVGPVAQIDTTKELYLPFFGETGETVTHILVVIDFVNDVPVPASDTRWSKASKNTGH